MRFDTVAEDVEHLRERLTHHRLIVDDKNGRCVLGHAASAYLNGTVTRNSVASAPVELEPNSTAMCCGNRPTDGQAEAETIAFRSGERLKQARCNVGGYAGAVVPHGDREIR